MDDAEACASPETSLLQDSYGLSKLPAGMAMLKCRLALVSVPETDPRPVLLVAVSVIVNVPDTDEPVCVTLHVMDPGPVESDAAPLQVPVRFNSAGWGLGVAGESQAARSVKPTMKVAKPAATRAVSIALGHHEQGRCHITRCGPFLEIRNRAGFRNR
jgi:hypothetical protein